MKKTLIISSLLLITVLVIGYVLRREQIFTVPGQNQSNSEVRRGAQAVIIQNFAFSPAEITVSKGTTVTWTNRDSAPHSIKSVSFNSASLVTSESFSFTFSEAGTFDYICGLHPSMKGRIIVRE